MDYRVGQMGRVVWARFDQGEDLIPGLTDLARKENLQQGMVLVLGALGEARAVSGPRELVIPPDPIPISFADGREILGIGSVAPGPDGPSIHLHITAGRTDAPATVGCLRPESTVYLVVEAVILELLAGSADRPLAPELGVARLRFQ